jgi:hypothetical protein
VYTPVESIEPHVGLHGSDSGFGVLSFVLVDALFGCTSLYWISVGAAFNSVTMKRSVTAGVTPTGIFTAVGVTETRMPESKLIVAVPVFFLSASAVAVSVIVGSCVGKLERAGAVNVTTVVSVETVYVPCCEVQGAAEDVVVVPFVAVVVVVNVHVHVIVNVVDPETVPVNASCCPAISVATDGDTATVTTFALELPHPASQIPAAIIKTNAASFIVRTFITYVSPTDAPDFARTSSLFLSRCESLLCLLPVLPNFRTSGLP